MTSAGGLRCSPTALGRDELERYEALENDAAVGLADRLSILWIGRLRQRDARRIRSAWQRAAEKILETLRFVGH